MANICRSHINWYGPDRLGVRFPGSEINFFVFNFVLQTLQDHNRKGLKVEEVQCVGLWLPQEEGAMLAHLNY